MPETAWDEPEAREKPSSAKLASLSEPIDDIAKMIEKLLDQKLQGLTTAITAAASAAGNRASTKKRTTSPKNKANADRAPSRRVTRISTVKPDRKHKSPAGDAAGPATYDRVAPTVRETPKGRVDKVATLPTAVDEKSASDDANTQETPRRNELITHASDNETDARYECCDGSLAALTISELHSRWFVSIRVGGIQVRAMLDAGATHTSMSRHGFEVAERCAARVIPAYNAVAKTFSGKPESILGRVEMTIEIGGVRHTMLVTVVEKLECACLLGVDFYRTFNAIVYPREDILTVDGSDEKIALEVASPSATSVCATATGVANLDKQQAAQLNELLDRPIPIADGPLGCTNLTKHRIIVDSAKPIRQRYYSVSPKIEEEMHSQVRGMLADGIIRRSDSQWSSPVVMVRKANGKYRFCVDYRKLNACTKVSAYPLHNMDAILRKLRDARYITTLDMSAGYHHSCSKTRTSTLRSLCQAWACTSGFVYPSEFLGVQRHFRSLWTES
ncbi:unnamed protein product [Trichogramma brassicae]|uniref:Reverse transcriptase domain-containing protein n=1 Tax=Trichogramma brassicae TaxID=86971 RepID=A0A6H5IF70_9HYME|nr:unnamed protein product [Trichogramma brassicae]